MPTLKRIGEDVLLNAFNAASAGRCRLSLRRALSELTCIFHGEDALPSRSESFMNEFYLRGIDVRFGLRSHALMVGGPKNLRGNPRGGLDAFLFYPCITREQFLRIGRAMECAFLERRVPHLSSGRFRAELTTEDLRRLERREQESQLNHVKSALHKD